MVCYSVQAVELTNSTETKNTTLQDGEHNRKSVSEIEVNLKYFTRKFLHNKFIRLLSNLHFDVMHIRSIIQQ